MTDNRPKPKPRIFDPAETIAEHAVNVRVLIQAIREDTYFRLCCIESQIALLGIEERALEIERKMRDGETWHA